MTNIKNLELEKIFDLREKINYIPNDYSMKLIAQRESAVLALLSLDKDVIIPEHSTTGEAFITVLEGEGIFNLNGTEYHLEPGKSIIIPANMKHSVKALTKLKFLLNIIK